MATIKVHQAHSYPIDEARQRLAPFEADMARFGTKLAWKGAKASVKGTGVSGELVLTASTAELTLKLGMLAKAAGVDARRLQQSIERRFAKALGE